MKEQTSIGDYRSLIVSHNLGTIRNSFTDMNSIGAGGLVGGISPGGLIQNCYTRGDLRVEATRVTSDANSADTDLTFPSVNGATLYRTTHGGLITAFLGGRMENVYTTGDISQGLARGVR